jgi:hypothetical protein
LSKGSYSGAVTISAIGVSDILPISIPVQLIVVDDVFPVHLPLMVR